MDLVESGSHASKLKKSTGMVIAILFFEIRFIFASGYLSALMFDQATDEQRNKRAANYDE